MICALIRRYRFDTKHGFRGGAGSCADALSGPAADCRWHMEFAMRRSLGSTMQASGRRWRRTWIPLGRGAPTHVSTSLVRGSCLDGRWYWEMRSEFVTRHRCRPSPRRRPNCSMGAFVFSRSTWTQPGPVLRRNNSLRTGLMVCIRTAAVTCFAMSDSPPRGGGTRRRR